MSLGLTNVALILLLLSVACSAAGGWVVGLYTALISNLAFNFFFLPPVYRLNVEQPNDVLALVLFLVVAAITASLLGRSRQSAREARRRASDTQNLLALGRATRDQPPERVPALICERIVHDFSSRACAVYRLQHEHLDEVAQAGDAMPDLTEDEQTVAILLMAGDEGADAAPRGPRRTSTLRLEPAGMTELLVPLAVETAPIGLLRVRRAAGPFSREEEELLGAFGDEAAIALHRATLAESARAAAAFEESDRLKSALLSSVSHDLRTPLTAIKASVANLMASEVQWSDAARQEFLGAIDRETDRLTRLVTNLLDLSRIEAGALRLDLDWNDLDELLRSAIYRVENAAPDRTLSLELAEALPLLRFDYVQIDRVLANLLDNALKYSPSHSTITVRAGVEGDHAVVSVRDQGYGIPDSKRQRIFEAFYRAERQDRSVSGSGLGLAICRGIVEAHGGTIWAGNDGGAVVSFCLPYEQLPAGNMVAEAPRFANAVR